MIEVRTCYMEPSRKDDIELHVCETGKLFVVHPMRVSY